MSDREPEARDRGTTLAGPAAAGDLGATGDLAAAGGLGATGDLAAAWIALAATRVAERRTWLTELDAAIGDGDHGINLDRGMRALRAGLDDGSAPTTSTESLLAWAGRTIMGTVGGASGALYGRAFLHAATGLAEDPAAGRRPAVERAAIALDAAASGIAALGRSASGEKTMLDALLPAASVLRAAADAGRDLADALLAAADAAEAGAGETIPMLATKGRASYLGERSIGHLDPGAASSAILLRALADAARARPG